MSSTSSAHMLPRFIDPRKFAQQGVNLKGSIELSALSRLVTYLAAADGDVDVDLVFAVDEQGFRCLAGQVGAQVVMTCQRCLEPCPQVLEANLNLALAWSDEQARQLPKTFDPWIVGEGQADLYQIIEDELILSLPIVAYHDYECVAESLFSSRDERTASAESESKEHNPFQVLAQLKGVVNPEPAAVLPTDTVQSEREIQEPTNGSSKK